MGAGGSHLGQDILKCLLECKCAFLWVSRSFLRIHSVRNTNRNVNYTPKLKMGCCEGFLDYRKYRIRILSNIHKEWGTQAYKEECLYKSVWCVCVSICVGACFPRKKLSRRHTLNVKSDSSWGKKQQDFLLFIFRHSEIAF